MASSLGDKPLKSFSVDKKGTLSIFVPTNQTIPRIQSTVLDMPCRVRVYPHLVDRFSHKETSESKASVKMRGYVIAVMVLLAAIVVVSCNVFIKRRRKLKHQEASLSLPVCPSHDCVFPADRWIPRKSSSKTTTSTVEEAGAGKTNDPEQSAFDIELFDRLYLLLCVDRQ